MTTRARLLTALLVLTSVVGAAAPVDASGGRATKPKVVQVEVRVRDQAGLPLRPATVAACPAAEDIANCPDLITAPTNRQGEAELTLLKNETYNITGFVADPSPPWECPGLFFNGRMLYLAENAFLAAASSFPEHASLLIRRPSANTCARVPISDDLGNVLSANMFVCPLAANGTPCATDSFPNRDRDGSVWLVNIDPTVTYRLRPFIVDSGWPCPGFVSSSGERFHFGISTDVLGADLLAGIAPLIIHHPVASECGPPTNQAAIAVMDDLGNVLMTANMFVCPLAADGMPCASNGFPNGTDSQGRLLINNVDPAVTYRLGPFIANSGWPCPGFVSSDGTQFHFGASTDVLGADLLAGIPPLIIHHPAAAECAPPTNQAAVMVLDDLGNTLAAPNLFICPLAADGTPCASDSFPNGTDSQGRLLINNVDPAVTYRLQPFTVNAGWPCPGFIGSDGSQFHFGTTQDFLGADLLAGIPPLIIHHPTAAECP